MNENIKLLLEVAKNNDWNITEYEGNITFQKFSPAGQDFSFEIKLTDDVEEFINDIQEYYEGYDVSYETYLWLDNEGHGTNGAPYDMMDVYNDMKACEENIKDLHCILYYKYKELEEIQ